MFCFGIITFLTNVTINEGSENNQIIMSNKLLSLSNDKSMFPVMQISHFDEELQKFSSVKKNSHLYTDPFENSNTINNTFNENLSTFNYY